MLAPPFFMLWGCPTLNDLLIVYQTVHRGGSIVSARLIIYYCWSLTIMQKQPLLHLLVVI